MQKSFMKFSALTAASLFGLFGTSAQADDQKQAAENAVSVCLVASAGFHIKSGPISLLIDAVHDQGIGLYPTASQDAKDKIASRTAPYDTVRAILSTHHHDDHLGKNLLRQLIKSYPDLTVIQPPQAFNTIGATITVTQNGRVVRLKGLREIKTMPTIKSMPEIKSVKTIKTISTVPLIPTLKASKMIATLPDLNRNTLVLQDENLSVRSYRISHGVGRDIENIGYLITLNGVTIFHPGDMDTGLDRLKATGIDGLAVDVLLIPYWYGLDKESIAQVSRAWQAKTIIPMHFESKEADWMADYGGLDGIRKTALKAWPNTVSLSAEGDCHPVTAPNPSK